MKKKKVKFDYDKAVLVREILSLYMTPGIFYNRADQVCRILESLAQDLWLKFSEKTLVQTAFSKEFKEYEVHFLQMIVQDYWNKKETYRLDPLERANLSNLVTQFNKLITG